MTIDRQYVAWGVLNRKDQAGVLSGASPLFSLIKVLLGMEMESPDPANKKNKVRAGLTGSPVRKNHGSLRNIVLSILHGVIGMGGEAVLRCDSVIIIRCDS